MAKPLVINPKRGTKLQAAIYEEYQIDPGKMLGVSDLRMEFTPNGGGVIKIELVGVITIEQAARFKGIMTGDGD